MDWNGFKYIETLAKARTLGKAAKLLGIDSSTLSRNLKSLERDLGFSIFKPNGKEYAITPEGDRWVRASAEMAKLVESVRTPKEAPLVLTSLEIFLNHFLLPHVSEIDGKVDFVGADRSLNLSRREADLAIRFGRPESGDYVVQKLCDVGHAIYQKRGEHPSQWVMLNDEFEEIPDVRWMRTHVPEPQWAHRVSSCEQILTLLDSGKYLGILPCYAGDRDPYLERLSPGKPIFTRTAWLVIHRDLATKKQVKALKTSLVKLAKAHEKVLTGER